MRRLSTLAPAEVRESYAKRVAPLVAAHGIDSPQVATVTKRYGRMLDAAMEAEAARRTPTPDDLTVVLDALRGVL